MVIHMPNNVWSAKLTGMYHQTIGNLTKSIERELAGLDATPQPKRVTTGRISVSPKPHSSRFKRYEKEGSNSAYSQLQNGKVEKPSTVTELRFKIHFDSQIRLLAIDQSTDNELRQRPVTYPPRQQQNKDRSKETNHHETTFLNVDGHRYESPPFSVVFNRIFCFCTHQTEDDHPPVPSTSLNFRIRYQDSEGDFITLISEDDWKLLLGDYYRATHIKRNGNLSQLGPMELYCDIPPIPHSRDIRSPEDQTRRIGGPSTGTCHVPVEFPGGERLKRIGAPSFTRNLFAPTHLKSKGMNANRALEHSDRRPSSVQKAPLCVRGAPTLGVVNNGKGNLPDKLTPNSKSNITPVIDRNIRFSCPKRVWNEQSEYDIPSIRSEETKSISHSFLPGVTPSSQISSNLEPQCWQEAHGEYDLRTMDSVETTELQNWAKKAMNEGV